MGGFKQSTISALLAMFAAVQSALAIDPTNQLVELYLNVKKYQAALKLTEVIGNMPDDEVKRHKFYKGNDNVAVFEKHLDDFLKHLEDWWECLGWKPEGICYKCSIYDCEFDLYKSYYYPVVNYEFSSKVFVSEYLYKTEFDVIGNENLEDYWYETAKESAVDEMDRAAKAIGGSVSASDYNFVLPDKFKERDIMNLNTSEQMEWRAVSTLSQSSYGSFPVPGDACHRKDNATIPYYSEMPLLIDVTRLGKYQDLFFFLPMLAYKQKLGGDVPNWGIGTSLVFGLSPHSWLSTTSGGSFSPIPQKIISTPHLGPDYGGTHMSGNEYSKKWLSQMLRASQYRNLGLSGLFPIQKEDSGRKKTLYQWLLPEHMPDSCDGKFPTLPWSSYGSFLNFGYKPQIDREEEGRAIITQWQWMRCCPSGYDVLVGDTPQYKF